MPKKLTDAIAALEQIEGGMIAGRVAASDELDVARGSALEVAHAEVRAATEAGPAAATALRDAIPPWARPLLDSALLASLDAVAEKHAPPTPERVVLLPFGAFEWAEDLASYECQRPLSVAGVAVSLSLEDVGPEDVAERLRAHSWLPQRLEEVVSSMPPGVSPRERGLRCTTMDTQTRTGNRSARRCSTHA